MKVATHTKLIGMFVATAAVTGLLACGGGGGAAGTNNQSVLASQIPINPLVLDQFRNPLPVIPVMQPVSSTVNGQYYVVKAQQTNHDFGLSQNNGLPVRHPVTGRPVSTAVWGYNGVYLGPTIMATKDVPVRVRYVNDLRDGAGRPLKKHLLTVDKSLEGCNNGEPEIRIVPHLHGGHTPAGFDGNPLFWFTNDPTYVAAAHPAFMGGVNGNKVLYAYPNDQRASTLWFHDHAMGVTRINVYAGLAAMYLLTDDFEKSLHLPGGYDAAAAFDDRGYDLPLVVQDKTFNLDGSLRYEALSLIDGSTGLQRLDSDGNPIYSSNPEAFQSVIIVNGKAWPFLDVEPRKYRFRVLNGSDSRFYNLWLENTTVGDLATAVPAMKQIGSEAGFLPAVVPVGDSSANGLMLANGERADIVIDFSGLAGKTFVMRNDAAVPFPMGESVNPLTTGRVMQFRVKAAVTKPYTGLYASDVALNGLLAGDAGLAAAKAAVSVVSKTKVVDLQELTDGANQLYDPQQGIVMDRLLLTLNALLFSDPLINQVNYRDYILLNDVEEWTIVNNTVDMHPIHLHLVQFDVIEKGSIAAGDYTPGSYAGGVFTPAAITGPLRPDVSVTGGDPALYTRHASETGLKETVRVPPGNEVTGEAGYVRIRAKFDLLGRYVWHCHILAHEENQMMRPFEVVTAYP